ncbi:hypothetical protein U9M48_029468 [Paspalum notatum var. saurae]|uniref:Uncharacterized protein n=1 Tax=Paspalum notatum var. saurae TaxID=547442 RepID=A0AAQ3U1K2_PASNO
MLGHPRPAFFSIDELPAEGDDARVLRCQDPEPRCSLGVVVLEQLGEAEEESGEVGENLVEPCPRLGPREEVVEEECEAVGGGAAKAAAGANAKRRSARTSRRD